jgi:hypothetical protein
LLFLLFVPDGSTPFNHHFVGTHHTHIHQVIPLPGALQERVEK